MQASGGRMLCFWRGRAMLKHIVVAADETEASRGAIRTALRWAAQADARVTIVTVGAPEALPAIALAAVASARTLDRPLALESIQRWLLPELAREPTWPTPEHAAAMGVPGIEIARF